MSGDPWRPPAGAIHSRMVTVPDLPHSYRLAQTVPLLRAALPAIESGLGGRVEWRLYCDASIDGNGEPRNEATEALRTAQAVHRKALRRPKRRTRQ